MSLMKHPLGYYVFQATFSLLEKDEKAGSLPSNPCICWVLRFVVIIPYGHSCASLLLANDVPMKQIQEWLGHSDISTTANIYSHLDYKSKLTSANVMDNVLTLPETEAVGWRT